MDPVWRAEIVLDSVSAAALLSAQFPQLEPIQIQPVGAGWDNWIFLVNDRDAFRFPRRLQAVPLINREWQVLHGLASHLRPMIPEPLYLGRPSLHYPYWFYGYRWMAGSVVSEVPISDRGRGRVAEGLGRILKRLHSIDRSTAEAMGACCSNPRTDLPLLFARLARYLADAQERGLISQPRRWQTLLESLKSNDMAVAPSALVHGDLNFRNVLVEEQMGLTALIDWGDVHWGYPAVDLSLIWGLVPPEERIRFHEAYGPINESTWNLARFYALYLNLIILVSAHDLGLASQVIEARKEIAWILGDG